MHNCFFKDGENDDDETISFQSGKIGNFYGVLVQLARTSALQAEGPEFDSQRLH